MIQLVHSLGLVGFVVTPIFVQTFIAKPYQVPSIYMLPAVLPHDHIMVDRLAYKFSPVARGLKANQKKPV